MREAAACGEERVNRAGWAGSQERIKMELIFEFQMNLDFWQDLEKFLQEN
jgi:hypothetical protein